MDKETRYLKIGNIETRSEGDKYILSGYINQYNQQSQFMGFFEQVAPNAFDKSLTDNDFIPMLFEHDDDKILGSTRSNTLNLKSDDIGLQFILQINPNISYANDAYQLVKSGDIQGCSFGFICNTDDWSTQDDGTDLRTIIDADLMEVSLTAYPAYVDSSAEARSCKSYDNHKTLEQRKNDTELLKNKLLIELEL